jgi:predicted 2-oxoglutarate/Fe(II)-dependent dioxygenase YbiX
MEFDKKNLLKTRTHGNVDSSKDDNVNVKMAPYTQDTISLIKKYSDMVIKKHVDLNGFEVPLYTVEAFLTVWEKGSRANPHYDSHVGYEYLQFATVLYLNDDYDGGEIFFPNQNFVYKPKRGDALLFPCGGTEYTHGVKKVLEGRRFTMPLWHSSQKDSASTMLN